MAYRTRNTGSSNILLACVVGEFKFVVNFENIATKFLEDDIVAPDIYTMQKGVGWLACLCSKER